MCDVNWLGTPSRITPGPDRLPVGDRARYALGTCPRRPAHGDTISNNPPAGGSGLTGAPSVRGRVGRPPASRSTRRPPAFGRRPRALRATDMPAAAQTPMLYTMGLLNHTGGGHDDADKDCLPQFQICRSMRTQAPYRDDLGHTRGPSCTTETAFVFTTDRKARRTRHECGVLGRSFSLRQGFGINTTQLLEVCGSMQSSGARAHGLHRTLTV